MALAGAPSTCTRGDDVLPYILRDSVRARNPFPPRFHPCHKGGFPVRVRCGCGMSIDATRWAWMQNVKPASLKLLLLSLADRANGVNFQCYPSIDRLCVDTGLDRKTVMRGLKQLDEIGLIARVVRPSVGNIYHLIGVQDRQSTERVFSFIYRTEDPETGEFYIGVHTTADMGDKYLGSGRWVTQHPHKPRLRRTVVQEFDSRADALRAENEIVMQMSCDPLCRNLRAERGNINQADDVERQVKKVTKTVLSPENGTKTQKWDQVPKTVPTKSLKRDQLGTENGTRTYQEPIKNQEERENTANVVAKTARGARLSLVALPDEWRDWTREHHPLINPEHTWEIFRDYWIAESGAKAVKHDWLATWRNWVRREQTKLGANHGNRYESAYDRRARINQSLIAAGQRAFDEVGNSPSRPLCGDLAESMGG